MEIASIVGLFVGLGSLILGYSMDDGNLAALWLLSAFVIVVGGALGSVAFTYGASTLYRVPQLYLKSFIREKSILSQKLDYIIMLSEHARKEGLLSIEKIIEDKAAKEKPDPLLRRGILMVIDGMDLEQIRELLETELYIHEEKSKKDITMFESCAAYAPAYGMIGTIIGLIKVLSNMESPEQMTSAIAVAFITTLYGVVIANLICLPTAGRLKNSLRQFLLEKEMIIEGVCGIRNGVNPKMLRDKLSIYLQTQPARKKEAKEKEDKVKDGSKEARFDAKARA